MVSTEQSLSKNPSETHPRKSGTEISLYAALAPCAVVCAIWGAWSFWPAGAPASEPEPVKPTIQIKATHTTETVLQVALAQKRPLTILLRNGTSYRGKVADVGSNAVVLEGVPGKEFFAIHVTISEIAAVELRIRD